ncbi:MAG: hypothetical protein ACLRQF_04945 [Thomasclavelia ramosa]
MVMMRISSIVWKKDKIKTGLIITYSEADYDNLSKIAPTVLVDYLNMSTAERITWMADVLNKKEEEKIAFKISIKKLLI